MNRNTRLLAVLAVALLAATVASFVVYRALAAGAAGSQQPLTVDTIVAARSIPAGTMITREHIKTIAWPAGSRLEGSLGDPRDVLDRGAIVAIAANEPITDAKLAAAGAGAGLPPTIPPGMRAISVRVNEVIGVAGFVVPGTRVDVLVTFEGRAQGQGSDSVARVVVSNAQVLTAGTRFDQEKARQDGKPIPTSVVTLLVSPEDAERIALAAAEGRITLTLRNPLDNAPTASTGIRAGGLMRGTSGAEPPPTPAPRAAAPKPAPVVVAPVAPPPPPPPYTVEAIRGAKRTQEPVKNEAEERPRDVPPSEENPR
jgi:pilus assembly protein CpaB